MDRISTGIAELDNILQGGFPGGTTILIVGRPGSGKTILAHQFMFHNASPGSKAVYLSTLSEPQVKVMKFQQEFSYFDHHKFQNSVIYRDLGSILRRHGPAQTLVFIDELLQKYQPRLIVMDTVRTIAEMIPSFTEFREFLLDLSMRLATWGCTALLLGEYCEGEIELRPESAIADGILFLSGTEERSLQKRYLRILKMRGTDYIGGENVFQITSGGIRVFPRINSLPEERLDSGDLADWPRLTTGLPGLDEMMDGGIPRTTTTLLSGASGTGKTLLALHFAAAGLAYGENAVYVSFEENPRQILAGARSLGLNLEQHLEAGRLKMLFVSPMELDVDINVYKIQRLVQKHRASRLVIDSISSFEIGMKDKFKYTDYIWALTDYFKARGVSMLLTHEMHNAEQVFELTKHGISYVADNLILLRYLEVGPDIKRYLRVVKMRASNHATILRELLISPGGISLGQVPGEQA